MNKYIYALLGLYFLLSCQKSQSNQKDLSNHSIHIMFPKDLIIEGTLSNKLKATNSDSSPELNLTCRQ